MKGNEGKSIMGAGWVAGEEEKIENFPHGFNKYELPTEVSPGGGINLGVYRYIWNFVRIQNN